MKLFMITTIFLLLPIIVFAHDPLNIGKDDSRIIYINNEIPAEILQAYNHQVSITTEMRLKVQALEQELYYTTERLTNLENQVWDMPASQKKKRTE